MNHQRRFCVPLCLALSLGLGLLASGCQSTSIPPASSSTPVPALSSASVSAPSESETPTISQEFTDLESVQAIEDLAVYVGEFSYSDIQAKDGNSAWKELVQRAAISRYPTGLVEYTAYMRYQGYQKMAESYGTDLDSMLAETMNTSHNELVAEIQREAKASVDAELVARYIIDKEGLITPESLLELWEYRNPAITAEDWAAGGGEKPDGLAEATMSLYDLDNQQVMRLANAWVMETLVVA